MTPRGILHSKRGPQIDAFILFCLVVALIWPLFRLEYMNNWPSIESTFIADARFLDTALPHPSWQPLWYCGTRFDYIYPPALRYGTALIANLGHVSTARSYHIYTGIFYVLGILSVYLLVYVGSASRIAAFLSALATALVSPSFLFLPLIRDDSAYWAPQRLHVLTLYGEGPHISALCILPAALACAYRAMQAWRPAWLAAAAALSALVVANNFYGATALAWLFPILVWAVWSGERSWRVGFRAALIVLLAYGLDAFWLTPSYVRITLVNLRWVSQPGNLTSVMIVAGALAVFGVLSWRFGSPGREWGTFVFGAAAILSLNVLGFSYWGLRVSGEPGRLIPELDLVLILFAVEVLRLVARWPLGRIAALAVLFCAFLSATSYLRHAWAPFPAARSIEGQYEYRISKWVHDNLPGARVLPSGTVRFWYDAWFDNAQPDGGSLQGMMNQNIPDATWQIMRGATPELAVLWLQALGTDAVIVPGRSSPEPYKDYAYPDKFRGSLKALYDDGQGTAIYAVPRVHPGIVRVVSSAAIASAPKIRGGDDRNGLRTYLNAVEDASQAPASVTWTSPDELVIRAASTPGTSLLLQETYDPQWRAVENGNELPVHEDPVMGFMLLDVAPGPHIVTMRFRVPLENRVGQLLLVLSLGALTALLFSASKASHVEK